MSQQIVLELLQELGGSATVSEISRLAQQKHPDLSLSHYVGDRVRKLEKWGFICYDVISNKYFIVIEQQKQKQD
jgi:hypothetical protein